jgi:PAS domain-containing protein
MIAIAAACRPVRASLGDAPSRGYIRPVDIELHAFPSKDGEFLAFVQMAWAGLPEPRTPDALQDALRARYPAAIVIEQAELARRGDGPIIWYAFRTASSGANSATLDRATDAWAILDDDRRFLEVSPALAQIAELPAEEMVGRLVDDLSNPADPSIREDIARLWSEFRSAGVLVSTIRFNFADGRPRELAYRLDADADGAGRHRLSVRALTEG